MARDSKKPKKNKLDESASITRSESFAATVKLVDGNKRLAIQSEVFYQHQLNKFKEGTKVTLEIHTRRPKRTERQNRYYWGVYLPLIAKETGEDDIERLHTLFKGKFLTKGIFEVLGQKVRITRSTTDLGVAEFCEYIMKIEGETKVEAPPTESWELAPLAKGVKLSTHK
jgi:hypothetical protein